MDFRSRLLLFLLAAVAAVAVGVSYYRTVVLNDFPVLEAPEEEAGVDSPSAVLPSDADSAPQDAPGGEPASEPDASL